MTDWIDPIVEEVRKVRHEHAAKLNFDLDAIVSDLQSQEAASGRTHVDLSRSAGSSAQPCDRTHEQPRS